MEDKKKLRLDVLLVQRGFAASRHKAQSEIMAGNVIVNEELALKSGISVPVNADIRLKKTFPYVGRGALKLIEALDHFHIEVNGKTAIDIGASTGGFTEVLLERGARLVYAVDAGTNQLDWKLRSDDRVRVMENTNARYIDNTDKYSFNPSPSIAVVDVSFISLTRILKPLTNILQNDFKIVSLIKPQFELEKKMIGKRGFVEEKYRRSAVERVTQFADSIGLAYGEAIESPITGAKSKNVEYLVCFTKLFNK